MTPVRRHEFRVRYATNDAVCTHCGVVVRAYVEDGGPLGIFGRLLTMNSNRALVVPSRVRCISRLSPVALQRSRIT